MNQSNRILVVPLSIVLLCCTLSAVAQEKESPSIENGSPTAAPSGDAVGGDPRQTLAKLGELMQRDWVDRPEWAQMAAAMLQGEDIGPGKGWFRPGEKRHDWDWLVQNFDADKNGSITQAELGDGVKDWDALDRSGDGQLTAADLETRSPMTPADPPTRMANMLFRLLDSDSNGKVMPEEMSLFFQMLDQDRTGFLTAADLGSMLRRFATPSAPPPTEIQQEYQPGVNPLRDLDMLLSGQYGSLNPGPAINDMAPDFSLRRQDASGNVTLSQLRGKPVVLIFGSFT